MFMHENELKERLRLLEEISKKIEKENLKFPAGTLRIEKKGKGMQYYHVTHPNINANGSYIKVAKQQLAVQLAQKSYHEKLFREIRREKRAISDFLGKMEGVSCEKIYDTLGENRKSLVTPLLISDDEYIRNWERETFETNPYNPEERVYETRKGDMVRSKSEAFIADLYYEMNIPYRYEAAFVMPNGRKKYPDFTLLKMPDRKIIYHEHMGMMEDEDYRRSNILKMHEYNLSGVTCGHNLILTFETEYSPLNIKDIRRTIENIWYNH